MTLYEYRAEILRVIDGDTVVARIDLGFRTFVQQTLRLYGIDAPEIRGPEKERGREASAYLRKLIELHAPITVHTIRDRTGKYGRYLATLYGQNETVDLNQAMVEAGFAKGQE